MFIITGKGTRHFKFNITFIRQKDTVTQFLQTAMEVQPQSQSLLWWLKEH